MLVKIAYFTKKNMSSPVQSLQISIILKKAVPKGTLFICFKVFVKEAQVFLILL